MELIKKEFLGKMNTNYHSYRNESFANYEKALSKFFVKDFNIIRFGSKQKKNVIMKIFSIILFQNTEIRLMICS